MRDAAAETKGYGRDAGLLTIALGSAGVLVYVYFALASHTLTKDEYGEIVVLWSVVYIAGSTLFRPIEQLLARSLAELDQRRGSAGRVIRVAIGIQIAIAFAAIGLAFAGRRPLEGDLLGRDPELFAILGVALLGFGANFFARGFLAGRRQFRAYTGLLLTESLSRVAFALVVAIGIADGRDLIAVGVAAGPLLSLVVMPIALRRHGHPQQRVGDDLGPNATVAVGGEQPQPAIAAAPDFTLSAGWRFAAAILLIMLSEQVIFNAGPLFVRAGEGAAAAGFIFNVLLVARAPLVLFQAVVASLLPHLTRLRSRGDETAEQAFRLSIRATTMVIAAFAATVLVGVLLVGPPAMQVAFGEKFDYDRLGLALVAVGMGLYLSAATLSQSVLAHGHVRRAASCWVTAAVLFIVINLLPALDAVRRVEIGFVATSALLCAMLHLLYRLPQPRDHWPVEPGSASEVEARLAAADEVA